MHGAVGSGDVPVLFISVTSETFLRNEHPQGDVWADSVHMGGLEKKMAIATPAPDPRAGHLDLI